MPRVIECISEWGGSTCICRRTLIQIPCTTSGSYYYSQDSLSSVICGKHEKQDIFCTKKTISLAELLEDDLGALECPACKHVFAS